MKGLFWPLSISNKTNLHTSLWSSFFLSKLWIHRPRKALQNVGQFWLLGREFTHLFVLLQAAVVYQNWLILGTRPQSLLCHKYLKSINFDDNPFSEKKKCWPYSVEPMIDVTTEFTWKAAGGGERRPGCLWRQHFLAGTLKPKNSSRIITGLTYIWETFEK